MFVFSETEVENCSFLQAFVCVSIEVQGFTKPNRCSKKTVPRPNKKRSLLRLTWLKFLRAGGRFFIFAEIFLHANAVWVSRTQMRCANLNFSRAENSNSGTVSLSDCQKNGVASVLGRACVLDGWPRSYVCVTSSSPLSRGSSPWAPLHHFRRWCEKRHGAGLLLFRQVSGVKMRSV